MEAFFDALSLYLQPIKDIATIITISIGAYVAMSGLRAWKRQLKGTTEYDLARRILKAVYQLRLAIAKVRSPLITAGEMGAAYSAMEEKPEDDDPRKDAKISAATYDRRWKEVSEAFAQIELEAIEGEVVWGSEAFSMIMDLRRSVNSLSNAIDMHLRHLFSAGRFLTPDLVNAFQEILYSKSDEPENDKYFVELNDRVSKIEGLLKPHLQL
jgi:hypothetical protein